MTQYRHVYVNETKNAFDVPLCYTMIFDLILCVMDKAMKFCKAINLGPQTLTTNHNGSVSQYNQRWSHKECSHYDSRF